MKHTLWQAGHVATPLIVAVMIWSAIGVRADINDGLVAYYPFDGNANDASGNGNNGTVYGATLTTNRFNQVNAAYNFDGSGDYMEVPHSSLFNINTNDFSLSVWLKYGPQPAPLYYSVVFIKVSNPGYPYEGSILFVDSPNNSCTFRIDGRESLYGLTNNLHNDSWRHFVCMKQSNQLKIYIDGSFDSSMTISYTTVDNLAPFIFGANYMDHNSQNYKGVMDDIRIYNRALTPGEITELYQPQSKALVITSAPTTVSYETSTCVLAGTASVEVVGYCWISNGATAATVSFPAGVAWQSPAIALAVGVNNLMLYGTNAAGQETAAATAVTRKAATPTGLAASDGTFTNKVALAWLAAPGAASYRVLRAVTNDSGSASTIAAVVTNTVYDDTSATPGLLYYYWLVAQQNGVEGDASTPDSGYRQLVASASIAATLGVYTNVVEVHWKSVQGATKYRVYRADSPLTNLAGVIATDVTTTNCTDTTAVPGLVYYYWVRAESAVAAGAWCGATPGYALLAANFADRKTWAMRDTKKMDMLICKQLPGPWSELLNASWSIAIVDALSHAVISGPYQLVSKNGKKYTYKSPTAMITYTERYNKRKDTYKTKLTYKFLADMPTQPGIYLHMPPTP